MTSITVVLACMAGLFLTLLQDRYRICTTLAGGAGLFFLARLAAGPIGGLTEDPALSGQLACWAGALLFFVGSLFFHTNNIVQKLFTALLGPCGYVFLELFLPLALGALPFSVAGILGGVLVFLFTLSFYLLLGLCLYRPLRHFCDRDVSGFMVGMCLLLGLLYAACLGKADFLFQGTPAAGRLLLGTLLLGGMVFCFRCVYQAGRFREKTMLEAARRKLMETEAGDFGDMVAAVRAVRMAQKSGEYALDTVYVMLQDGVPEQIPAYIYTTKHSFAATPILASYHENPYINAVIAVKAAYAIQNGVDFQCNASTGQVPLKTAELCILCNELLSRACREVLAYGGEKRLRFTCIPAEDSLRLEAVYTADPPEKPSLSPKGLKGWKLSELLQWFIEDAPEEGDDLKGLENTAETVLLHSGSLSVSRGAQETILQAVLRF